MIKDTNPDHYKVDGADFAEYMHDPKISGFGNWMFANGYNTGTLAARPQWISVNDRLPPMYHMVLITGKNSVGGSFGVIKGSHDGDKAGWYRDDVAEYAKSREDVITHWMPLPEPPKEEKHET